jgi:Rod binding domain-containing protein
MSDLALTSEGRIAPQGSDPALRLKQASKQFEQVFVGLLMKREPLDDEPFIDGDAASQQFKELRDSALSEKAAGHLGIADILLRELGARTAATGTAHASPTGGAKP